ncbi:hypothetical protein OESDEN_01286 [Oesophagostomum dentatum]|uniref:Uncharacterized protein n=1 Tax=Oesophagostomum dentatum TaxID=61180 RepID=A0A0B1TSC9_OESDE|nr:hypothetical protein OESDEN_01286 [Oesophagostomum dentatum]
MLNHLNTNTHSCRTVHFKGIRLDATMVREDLVERVFLLQFQVCRWQKLSAD